MSLLYRILILITTALLTTGAQSCSGDPYGAPDSPATTMLTIRVNLAGETASRAMEADKEAANNGEKMNTLRVIILDGDMVVEHNSLWTLSTPDVQKTGLRFKVKANDLKTIIFVANEAGTVINIPATGADGATTYTAVDVAEYFGRLNPTVGMKADLDEMRGITMDLERNLHEGTGPGKGKMLRSPLAINDIHTYAIGNAPEYNATFYIGRAAVKYTFRITNNDKTQDHRLTSLTIGRVAPVQYFFQNAVFTDDNHFFWSDYSVPLEAGSAAAVTIPCGDLVLPKNSTTEVGPFYFPEGGRYADPYTVGLAVDGPDMGTFPIYWKIPEQLGTSEAGEPMTDLPRNTHVITNITLNYREVNLQYTVCPWQEYDIDIPGFN